MPKNNQENIPNQTKTKLKTSTTKTKKRLKTMLWTISLTSAFFVAATALLPTFPDTKAYIEVNEQQYINTTNIVPPEYEKDFDTNDSYTFLTPGDYTKTNVAYDITEFNMTGDVKALDNYNAIKINGDEGTATSPVIDTSVYSEAPSGLYKVAFNTKRLAWGRNKVYLIVRASNTAFTADDTTIEWSRQEITDSAFDIIQMPSSISTKKYIQFGFEMHKSFLYSSYVSNPAVQIFHKKCSLNYEICDNHIDDDCDNYIDDADADCDETLIEDNSNYTFYEDISYSDDNESDSPFQYLDIYVPEAKLKKDSSLEDSNTSNYPVMIFVHGGAWEIGDKGNHTNKGAAFTNNGYIFVSINYRLDTEEQDTMHPDHTKDVAEAIAWVHNNIEKYQGDPDKLFLMGHSVGTHMISLSATNQDYLNDEGLSLSDIKGLVLLDGAEYDIPVVYELNPTHFDLLLRPEFGDDENVWISASPRLNVEERKDIPPAQLFYAGNRIVARIQAQLFANSLTDINVNAEVVSAEDRDHQTISTELGKPGDQYIKMIFKFLEGIISE
ncbi:MAG: alpha/beta hydrolase [bacterium]